MKDSILKLFILSLSLFLGGCLVFGIRSGYEQPKYSVVDKLGDIEIRRYEPRLAAEVVDAKDDREGFFLLFDFISGKNSTQQKISMTSPVEVDKGGVKISMTTPVETSSPGGDKMRMRFFMPNALTKAAAPNPLDPRVQIIEVPAQTYAVLRYSGSSSREKFQMEARTLLEAVSGSKWRPVSEPIFFGYDPPFTIPFLRRNEALVLVDAS